MQVAKCGQLEDVGYVPGIRKRVLTDSVHAAFALAADGTLRRPPLSASYLIVRMYSASVLASASDT